MIDIKHPLLQRTDDGKVCRSCGCSQNNACIISHLSDDGSRLLKQTTCSWAHHGPRPLCTACLPVQP